MKVRYTKTALAEIDEIRSYIARDNPKAAAAIEKTVNRITRVIGFHSGRDSFPPPAFCKIHSVESAQRPTCSGQHSQAGIGFRGWQERFVIEIS